MVNIREPIAKDALDADEARLHALIEVHRSDLGLPAVLLSASLTVVAGRKDLDTLHNVGGFQIGAAGDQRARLDRNAFREAGPRRGFEIAVVHPAPLPQVRADHAGDAARNLPGLEAHRVTIRSAGPLPVEGAGQRVLGRQRAPHGGDDTKGGRLRAPKGWAVAYAWPRRLDSDRRKRASARLSARVVSRVVV